MGSQNEETGIACNCSIEWVFDRFRQSTCMAQGAVVRAASFKEAEEKARNLFYADSSCRNDYFRLRDTVRTCDSRLELLAACIKAQNYISSVESEFGITLETGELLRAAIAKATA